MSLGHIQSTPYSFALSPFLCIYPRTFYLSYLFLLLSVFRLHLFLCLLLILFSRADYDTNSFRTPSVSLLIQTPPPSLYFMTSTSLFLFISLFLLSFFSLQSLFLSLPLLCLSPSPSRSLSLSLCILKPICL